jgi:hypothetical protein
MADSRLPWSVAFAQLYLGFATPAPFRAMIHFTENLRLPSQVSSLPLSDYLPPMDVVETAIKLLKRDALSFGQYYFLLKIVNLVERTRDLARNVQHDLALTLIRLMRQLWKKLPSGVIRVIRW